ncbi:Sodium/calcium exchanger protein-domain-containing protein [Pelagophyceae sp. CCMP2097]|nr:Sodium/calcium exchanger protein-domain-containing protein [Pelagophyceae sp. CCMP2097]
MVPEELKGPWVALLALGACMMFWALAVITEERFVPALNAFARRWKIPAGVAGATLMAAGASSPELFCNILAIFVTHSELGVGTIIGSELFNHMVISAGAVRASRTGMLQLEMMTIIRECSFYLLALYLLGYAVADVQVRYVETEDGQEKKKTVIVIHSANCLPLLFCYVAYVFVCAGGLRILANAFRRGLGCPKAELAAEAAQVVDTSQDVDHVEARDEKQAHSPASVGFALSPKSSDGLMNLDVEPHERDAEDPGAALRLDEARSPFEGHEELALETVNLEEAKSEAREGGSPFGRVCPSAKSKGRSNSIELVESQLQSSLRGDSRRFKRRISKSFGFKGVGDDSLPQTVEAIREARIEPTAQGDAFGCWLWRASRFYSSVRITKNSYQLRWWTVNDRALKSRHGPNQSQTRTFDVSLATECVVTDAEKLRFTLVRTKHPYGHLDLVAPSSAIMYEVVRRINALIDRTHHHVETGRAVKADDDEDAHGHEDDEHVECLIEWPHRKGPAEGTALALIRRFVVVGLHVLLLPLKVSFHYTIPDSRLGGSVNRAMGASVAWLAITSYIMVACCENLGEELGISSGTIGITVGAVGTSLPNLISSMVVAREGFGDMAVSNALGSNIFNIVVALGVPWFLYPLIYGEPFSTTVDSGVFVEIWFLAVVLVGYILMLAATRLRLYSWMQYGFILVWIIGLAIAIGLPGSLAHAERFVLPLAKRAFGSNTENDSLSKRGIKPERY